MSLVKIPFCHLPNTLFQIVNTETMLRSKFQIDELVAVAARPDFAYFVISGIRNPVVIPEEFKGPYSVMWYDKSGQCHGARLGANQVLDGGWRLVGTGGRKPAPQDSPVYASRTA